MNILFVSSGNSSIGISPIVHNQGLSLESKGVKVDYFTVKGKGIWGYLRNVPTLRKYTFNKHFDIVHSHYSLSAFIVVLSRIKLPHIVSLMGSDAELPFIFRIITRFCSRYFWDKVILKSERMNTRLNLNNYFILPNGVNLEHFIPMDRVKCCKMVGFSDQVINVTFFADPNRTEKNYESCEKAVNIASSSCQFAFHLIYDVSLTLVPIYLNATDIIILTSRWEGSPNVIKEAMACNTSVVSTNVGDVSWLFGDEQGYYLTQQEPYDIALKLKYAIINIIANKKTNGRQRIINLGLDSQVIAESLINLYNSVVR